MQSSEAVVVNVPRWQRAIKPLIWFLALPWVTFQLALLLRVAIAWPYMGRWPRFYASTGGTCRVYDQIWVPVFGVHILLSLGLPIVILVFWKRLTWRERTLPVVFWAVTYGIALLDFGSLWGWWLD